MAAVNNARRAREGSFGFLVQALARKIDAIMKEKLADHSVDTKIFANLMMLAEEDGINQRQLGKKLNIPEYYTSRSVDALEKAGYAERRPDPTSRRSILIFITKVGKDKVTELRNTVQETNKRVLSGLTKVEQREFIRLLQKANGIDPLTSGKN